MANIDFSNKALQKSELKSTQPDEQWETGEQIPLNSHYDLNADEHLKFVAGIAP